MKGLGILNQTASYTGEYKINAVSVPPLRLANNLQVCFSDQRPLFSPEKYERDTGKMSPLSKVKELLKSDVDSLK